MEHLTHTILLLSGAAAGSLVNAIAEGIILAAAVGICLRMLPAIRPAARFVIWTAVLFAVLPLHFVTFAGDKSSTSLASHLDSFHLDARVGLLIIGFWGALSLLRAMRLLRSALELRRIAASATPVVLTAEMDTLINSSSRRAQLCVSTDVDRPSVAGFLHPRILLPPHLLRRLSPQELEQIVLHEMEHLRRRDDWTNLIQKISLILFPLNPVLHWIERRLCVERELACDDQVLHCTRSRKTYAACLTNLAEHSLLHRGVTLALGAWERQSELARRVHRILRKPEEIMGRTPANILTGTVIAGLLGGAVTLAHSPALVSFSPAADVGMQAPVGRTISSQPIVQPVSQAVRQTGSYSPTLVKAVMPEPQQKTVSRHPRVRRQTPVVKAVHRPSQPQPQDWIVLTGWQVVSVPSRPAIAAAEGSQSSSYAAVSVGNGWLVIQL